MLLHCLKQVDLKSKTVLELGAGSGLISLFAAKKGATVTASDISKKALQNIEQNKEVNQLEVETIHSDLFQHIPKRFFDLIMINPPYYKGNIRKEDDHAWYAGEQLEYFQKLFQQLASYMNEKTKTLMVLSDDCDITRIKSIATEYHFRFHLIYSKKIFLESNFVFEIKK